jgi:hypothetical protein
MSLVVRQTERSLVALTATDFLPGGMWPTRALGPQRERIAELSFTR